jgi:hypothetical protein
MAKFRQVHVDYWQDGFVLDLTPEEKYFFLYLMTNSKTSQCGIYELPKRIIETETGYNRETVDKLLGRFIEYGKIQYNDETKEIFIVNWIKHNKINSPKVKGCITKELQAVKYVPYIQAFYQQCQKYGYSIDTVSIPYTNGIDSLSIDLGEEQQQEKEKEQQQEKEKEQQQEPVDGAVEIIANKFMQLRGKGFPSTNDYNVIKQVIDDGVPTKDILYYLEECFRHYTPKHSMDRINSFAYCAQYILNRYTAKNVPKSKRKGGVHSGGSQSGDESDFEYIGL